MQQHKILVLNTVIRFRLMYDLEAAHLTSDKYNKLDVFQREGFRKRRGIKMYQNINMFWLSDKSAYLCPFHHFFGTERVILRGCAMLRKRHVSIAYNFKMSEAIWPQYALRRIRPLKSRMLPIGFSQRSTLPPGCAAICSLRSWLRG